MLGDYNETLYLPSIQKYIHKKNEDEFRKIDIQREIHKKNKWLYKKINI